MVKEPKRLGMAHRAKLNKKLRRISEEEALENERMKAKRIAEKLGWDLSWLHQPIPNLRKTEPNRVVYEGHGN